MNKVSSFLVKRVAGLVIVTLCAFAVSLVFPGCKADKKIKVDFDFEQPDVSYRYDSSPDPLYVYFDGSAAKLEDAGKEIVDGISIDPVIKGTWKWSSDTELLFTPSEPWVLNTRYKVVFNSALFAEQIIVDKGFSFTTDDFNAYISDAEFYIDPEDASIKRIAFSIYASHPMVKDDIDSLISLTLNTKDKKGIPVSSKKYAFHISWNKEGTEAYIISDPIPIPVKTSSLDIEIKSGIKAEQGGTAASKMSDSVEIPGMNDYVQVRDIFHDLVSNDKQNYDQVFMIESKGSVSGEELMNHLSVWILPKDRPEEQGWKAERNYNWYNTDYVTDMVLSLSKKISISLIPSELDHSSLNSFKFSAPPGSHVYVSLTGNINFYGGYKLADGFNDIFRVKDYPKELGILSEGTILSLSGSRAMAISSRGIQKVQYSLSRIMPKDVHHLISMSNGNLKNFSFSSRSFDEDNISESITSSYTIPDYSNETLSYFSYDFTNQLKKNSSKNLKNGLFIFEVAADNGSSSRSNYRDKRFILVTDLGLIVKGSTNGSKDVFVQSIATGNPVANAVVSVSGMNGNPVFTASTGRDGHVSIPDLSGYKKEHEPIAYIVETDNDLSFMPYSERGRSLDYSNYDVGGIYGTSDPSKISAFMFSDRGMYRPGDTVNMGLIIKAGDWNYDLSNLPLEFVVTDSNGANCYTEQFKLSSSSFNEISFTTQDYSPTGIYDTTVYFLKEYAHDSIERVFLTSKSVKIEEFLPDTLALSTGFDPLPGEGWIHPGSLSGTISLKNLFGTPASGNDIKAQLSLTPGFPILRKYSDYRFFDPYSKNNSYEEYLGASVTDDKGEASYNIDLQKFEKATYRLEFYVEAFEKGSGRNVSQQSSIYVSPLEYLIGYKADGDLSYINKDSKRKISFIAIDKELQKIDLKDISLVIQEQRYVSTLVKQKNGLYKYQSVRKDYPVSSQIVTITKNGFDFFLPSETAGEYTLSLLDSKGLVFNKLAYSIVGKQNLSRSLTRTAELELRLEKNDLKAGSTAKVFIKAPYTGSGLITVEREKVYTWKWFSTSSLSSEQTIEIPVDIEGNGYINVMFSRSSASDEIFMSPFCYGSIPFSVDKENRTNHIELTIPDEIKSGTDMTIEYSSSDAGRIIVYAVDEGILQVAGYTLPDPLSFFFQKRALEVRTSQIMDLVLPEYEILRTIAAMGGGAGMDELSHNLNPFKRKRAAPVVFWSGVINTDSSKRSLTYHIPDYFNGTIRVMAVAVSPGTIGTAQKTAVARNAFVITPNVPLSAAPGDEFDISVTVANSRKGSGEKNAVKLELLPSKHLEVLSDKRMDLVIPEGKDVTVNFSVKAKNELGGAELLFTAKDTVESSALSATLSVRPSMPYQIWIQNGSTNKNAASLKIEHTIYEEFARRTMSVSGLPSSFFEGLSFYLEKYPYGCSEQITSQAYPYIFAEITDLAGKTDKDAKDMVAKTVGILQSRMKSNGHIGYWTNKSKENNFVSLYCADFLTDASKKGFFVSSSFFSKVLSMVEKIASGRGTTYSSFNDRAYAIYILTKNEKVTTSYIETLEQDIKNNKDASSEYPGLYLAASYAMMKQTDKGNKILSSIKRDMIFDSSWEFHNNLHYVSSYIDIISQYFPHRAKDIKTTQLELLSKYIGYEYYNTYSTSAAIRAVVSYAQLMDENGKSVYKVFEKADKTETEIPVTGVFVKNGIFSKSAQEIIFKNTADLPMYYQTLQAGFETEIPAKAVKEGIEVYREFCNNKGEKITSMELGEEITVKISFRSVQKGYINNVAIIDMLSAGLEADIDSIRNNSGDWNADYIDIREDRVILYGSITDSLSSFSYKARAITTGSFTVPPMFAEAMYNKDVRGIAPQDPLVITKGK